MLSVSLQLFNSRIQVTLNGFQNLFILMRDIYTKKGWKIQNRDLPIFFIAGEDDPVIINKKAWQKSQKFLKEIG